MASDTNDHSQGSLPDNGPVESHLYVPINPQPTTETSRTTPKTKDDSAQGLVSRISTHGHTPFEIEPMSKHSGASVATFFHGLFQTILAISTLGASVTFNYVLSNSSSPDSPTPTPSSRRFSADTVQLFLAVSWLLFLLALAFAALGSTLLTFFRRHWEEDWDGKRGTTSQTSVQMYGIIASSVVGGLTVGAFIFLCLVVVAYQAAVGWIALGFTSFFGLVIFLSIIHQTPWPWRDNTPHVKTVKRVSV